MSKVFLPCLFPVHVLGLCNLLVHLIYTGYNKALFIKGFKSA